MKTVTVSAPGKVILMGDHAVVYGKPGIAAAIDRRLTVTVSAPDAGIDDVVTVDGGEPDRYVRHILGIYRTITGSGAAAPVRIAVSSAIRPGYHLGSSAAVAAATIGALSYYFRGVWNPVQVNQMAYEAEKGQHGTPSGVDNTVVTMGGFVWYRKELEFLKSMWQLPVTLPPGLDGFFLVDTGRPAETTGEMVAFVRQRGQAQPARMERLLAENERQTKRIADAIKSGDGTAVVDAIRRGERTLGGFGVVSPVARRIIRAVEAAGGAAKILGGGGREAGVGYLLAFHPDKRALETALARFGKTPEPVRLGEEGIRLERRE